MSMEDTDCKDEEEEDEISDILEDIVYPEMVHIIMDFYEDRIPLIKCVLCGIEDIKNKQNFTRYCHIEDNYICLKCFGNGKQCPDCIDHNLKPIVFSYDSRQTE